MVDTEDFLSHHGIRGMKWGQRRSKKELRERAKRDKASKNRRHLSDDELKQRIERLSNEKKLKSLTDEDLRPGKTVTKKILSDSGQKVARTVVAGAGLYAVKVAVDRKSGKKMDLKEAAGYIAPRPKNK